MKNRILIFPFVIMGTCFMLTSSCKKDESTPALSTQDSPLKVTMPNGDVIYVSPTDNDVSATWGGYESDIPALANLQPGDAGMDFNGEVNTAAIITHLGNNNGTSYAAKRCADLEAYGFNDWYLPAAGELNEMYKQLGPIDSIRIEIDSIRIDTIRIDIDSIRIDTIRIKIDSIRNVGGTGQIIDGRYWSSTEFSSFSAWRQNFSNGFQVFDLKRSGGRCRCVRRSGEKVFNDLSVY